MAHCRPLLPSTCPQGSLTAARATRRQRHTASLIGHELTQPQPQQRMNGLRSQEIRNAQKDGRSGRPRAFGSPQLKRETRVAALRRPARRACLAGHRSTRLIRSGGGGQDLEGPTAYQSRCSSSPERIRASGPRSRCFHSRSSRRCPRRRAHWHRLEAGVPRFRSHQRGASFGPSPGSLPFEWSTTRCR